MMKFAENSYFRTLVKTFQGAPWSNKAYYLEWLAQSYFYTSQSTRMLASAAGWSSYKQGPYFKRSLQHIREESGHELLAAKDLKQFEEDIENYDEMGLCRALWEPQFFKILRNPESLLGYILCLEMLAVETFKPLYEIQQKTYPQNQHLFVKVHADDDPDHVEEALAQIEMCSDEVQEIILKNFEQTAQMYQSLISHAQEKALSASQVFSGHSNMYSTLSVDAQPKTLSS